MVQPNPAATTALPGNADFDWEAFDSADYFAHNYRSLLREDAEIIRLVADFFAKAAPRRWRTRAIDVGSGANLYPAMTMLPFASEIVLYERAHRNRAWLADQLADPADSWQEFWEATSAERPEYGGISKPLELLGRNARVTKGNVFDLRAGHYDMGTMFFVAESITTRPDEFRRAIEHFVQALAPKAPFATAFMRKSSGYKVAGRPFPACYITEDDVDERLNGVANVEGLHLIESHAALRPGYDGMIVAYGHTG